MRWWKLLMCMWTIAGLAIAFFYRASILRQNAQYERGAREIERDMDNRL